MHFKGDKFSSSKDKDSYYFFFPRRYDIFLLFKEKIIADTKLNEVKNVFFPLRRFLLHI